MNDQQQTSSITIPVTQIKIKEWLNANQTALNNKPIYSKRIDRTFQYGGAHTYWVFGKRMSGKSNVLEAIATNAINEGATIFDIYSAKDDESLAWLRSPYKKKVLLICSDMLDLTFEKEEYDWVHLKDFTIRKGEGHQVVVTVPGFYSHPRDLYSALSYLLDRLKYRKEWDKVILLLVREAARLIQSRIMAGTVKNAMEAEYDFLEVVQESYHNGVGVAVDSLRPSSIEINIREISNYTFIKRMGRLNLPREFRMVMHYVKPPYIRRMPLEDFLLYTDNDDLFWGKLDLVPWHIVRGENIMRQLGIVPVPAKDSPFEKTKETTTKLASSLEVEKPMMEKKVDRRVKVDEDKHREMVSMHEQGMGYVTISEALGFAWITVRSHVNNHQKGRCTCSKKEESSTTTSP